VKFNELNLSADLLAEIEKAGFGWVFDCPGIEIEEVKG